MRRFSIVVAALALASVGMLAAASPAFAETVLEVTPMRADATPEIRAKLLEARKNATAKNPYVVKVTPGFYTIGSALRLYSNTTLVLEGVNLRLAPLANCNMIRVGDPSDTQTGYYYKNIRVVGGDLDNTNHQNTCVKLAHAKNLSIEGVTMHNTRSGHLMEVGGVADLTVDGCTFRDQRQASGAAIPEALQIDVLNQKHMPSYRSEDLPTKNVVIANCTFSNVPRGIGSHTAVLNRYTKNVVIRNNTFSNLRSDAIRLMNYYDCRIEGNVIKGAPRGIAVYMGHSKGMYFGASLAKEGGMASSTSSAYKAPPKNQHITIRNNTIATSGTDCYYGGANDGIFLCGYSFSRKLTKTVENDAIPKGNYYVSGIKVTNNTIKTRGHGIRLDDARNCTVKGNKITFVGNRSVKASYHGIYLLSGSNCNTIAGNKIVKVRSHGVFVASKSKGNVVKGNIISASGQYGISVQGAQAKIISKNTIAKSGSHGIVLLDAKGPMTVSSNKVTKSKKYAAFVDAKSKRYRMAFRANKLSATKKANAAVAVESGRVSVSGSKKMKIAPT
ncbi:right-handed parallel beta-helix repeat-containing protein [Eggerthellaceae bacterium 24-137]